MDFMDLDKTIKKGDEFKKKLNLEMLVGLLWDHSTDVCPRPSILN
jgi:hypothetical protein